MEDLVQLLASFRMGFDVDEITIDEVVLSEWLQAIGGTLVARRAIIDSLELSSVEMDLLYELLDEVTAQQAMLDSLNSIPNRQFKVFLMEFPLLGLLVAVEG